MSSLPAHLAAAIIFGLLALVTTTSSPAAVSYGEMSVPLSNFTIENGPLRMHGVSDSFDIYIPLASTAEISNTWLDLRLAHSIALLGKRSSLRVLFNDATVAQLPYDPEQPQATPRYASRMSFGKPVSTN